MVCKPVDFGLKLMWDVNIDMYIFVVCMDLE